MPLADRLIGAGTSMRRAECVSIKVSAWHVKFRVCDEVNRHRKPDIKVKVVY